MGDAKRDPRTDPRPGDVLMVANEPERRAWLYQVQDRTNRYVWSLKAGDRGWERHPVSFWETLVADATVLHTEEAP